MEFLLRFPEERIHRGSKLESSMRVTHVPCLPDDFRPLVGGEGVGDVDRHTFPIYPMISGPWLAVRECKV